MVVFSLLVIPNLKNYRTEAAPAPADGAELFGIIVLLVNQVSLIENLLHLLQADTVPSLYSLALQSVKLDARITVISKLEFVLMLLSTGPGSRYTRPENLYGQGGPGPLVPILSR